MAYGGRTTLRGQRGYVTLTMAVIALMFSTVLVVPLLTYTQASLLAARKTGSGLGSLSCGSVGTEHALWRLRYDQAFISSLTAQHPSASYTVVCDSHTVPVGVTLESSPSSLPDYLLGYAYADIVLVMDISSSVSSSEMTAFKQAANAIVDGFNLPVNGQRYRIGVTKFGKTSLGVVAMTNTAATVHTGINGLQSTSLLTCVFQPNNMACGTNTVAGLQGGGAQYATGLGDRAGIPNLMVFLTDGNDNAGNNLTAIETAAAATGAQIFAVGIDDVFTTTLDAIASDPNSGHVFYTMTFDQLLALIDQIVSAVTHGAGVGWLYDIQVTAPDGGIIHVHALRTLGGQLVVVSAQE